LLTQQYGCNLLVYPGAFNLTTGPAHWELLQRGRAVDNQCFVLTASPARTNPPPEGKEGKYPHYSAWGHSSVINPWGEVVATCDEKETVVVANLDMAEVKNMRQGIPTFQQKRLDLYKLTNGDK
jgi:omega-amidase